jgi:hypothetical protein
LNGDLRIQASLEILGGGEMVGVGVCLEDIPDAKPGALHERLDAFNRVGVRLRPSGVVVEHRIDDDRLLRVRV